MQLLQPEIKEIQQRYKGDAMKTSEAQQALYKERGVNPLAGCLPLLLQMPLLFIMYSVIQHGLTSYDPTAMLMVFGHQVVPLTASTRRGGPPDPALGPCINTIIPLPGGATINVGLAVDDLRDRSASGSASWPSSRRCSSSCSRG